MDSEVAKPQMGQGFSTPYVEENNKLKCNQMLVNRIVRGLENTRDTLGKKEARDMRCALT